jgi:acetyl esterase/lipase
MRLLWIAAALVLAFANVVHAADKPDYFERKQDVVYGRLPGIALTMDVFTPTDKAAAKPNGCAVIWVISGGWMSAHESIDGVVSNPFVGDFFRPLIDRGYTVFAVVHASQPKYTIPEILPQINRAVRYIRFHAKDYNLDPEKIGIIGASAGGHLSLMQGCKPEPTNANAPDPVDRVSSKVQAVCAFVPPTDFLNFGGDGVHALGEGPLGWLKAPFDFVEPKKIPSTFLKEQVVYEKITDEKRREEIGKAISPIYHVDAEDAPIFILAGEVDKLVPLQQMKTMKAKLDEAKVPNELFVRAGADHAWKEMGEDMKKVADWYDRYLLKQSK